MRLICLVVLLAGCATSRETYLPDGSVGHSIQCSGAALSWGQCIEKAGELCGSRGYETLVAPGEQGVVATGSQYGAFAGTTHNRNMIIKCK